VYEAVLSAAPEMPDEVRSFALSLRKGAISTRYRRAGRTGA